LEKGTFRWPEVSGDQSKVQLSHEELALLLGGKNQQVVTTCDQLPTPSSSPLGMLFTAICHD
jgi:hypothetical protein